MGRVLSALAPSGRFQSLMFFIWKKYHNIAFYFTKKVLLEFAKFQLTHVYHKIGNWRLFLKKNFIKNIINKD
jgi:hypothetical protein